ncbi:arabinose-proton symporter-like, partial [Bombus impatiens]|uniref:Arabinose-proton symporter-like n=1 Tax=Bombus impatiens TaxID=132113 RepID=A0A6P3V5N3_BOMIM
MTMCLVGTVYGWTETSFLLFTSGIGNTPLTLTPDEYSWVVSLTVLGSMIGSLLAVQLADRIGRKYCLIACSIVFIIGWLDTHSSTSVQMLYLARGILGIGVGIARTINPMFVSEVADVKLRGGLSTLIAANVYPGSLLTYALGPSLTYTSHLLLLAGISAISTLLLICLRETPYFLVAKGKKEQACKSIAYYKGIEDPDQVKVELRALRAEARYGLHQQFTSDLHSQSRSDLPVTYSSALPSASCSDLPPPYSSILPAASSSDLPPSYSSCLPPPSGSDLPPSYKSNSPSRSI